MNKSKIVDSLKWFFLIINDKETKIQIVKTAVITALTTVSAILIPIIFKEITDQIVKPTKNYSGADFSLFIKILLLTYCAIWILNKITVQLRTMVILITLEKSIKQLSLKIFKHLHDLSMRFHLDRKTGAITNAIERAQSSVEGIFFGLCIIIIPTFIELIVITAIFYYFYGIDYGIAFFISISVYLIVSYFGMLKLDEYQKLYNEERSKSSEFFVDSMINAETVKLFNNQDHEYNIYKNILQSQELSGIKRHKIEALLQTIQSLIIGITLMYITYKSGSSLILSEITLGDFILINSYFMQFAMPLEYISQVVGQVRKCLVGIGDVVAIIETQPEIIDMPNAYDIDLARSKPQAMYQPVRHSRRRRLEGISPQASRVLPQAMYRGTNQQAPRANLAKNLIEFDNVNFGYNQDRLIIKDITLCIETGKTTAIVGTSGAGKSTITRLIFRMYDTISGDIKFNDLNIRNIAQKSLHKNIGVVTQDTNVFNNSIYYNILYGRTDATKEAVEEAAKHARLDDFIKKLPDGYNTIIGERGLKLSGGERQRLAIARVLLKNPLLYIFDEATSSLDNNTELEIQKNIKEITKDKTTLIIAHRLSTVMHADMIVVLDSGIIVEKGTHLELIALGGLYHKLWFKQGL